MKVNNISFVFVMLCIISNIRDANCRPKPNDIFKGNQLVDREETCQRCAKATKSPDAYRLCKTTDKGYTFCSEFVAYGSVQTDNNEVVFRKEHYYVLVDSNEKRH